MKWLGYQQKRVSSLKLPGSLAARKKLPHVIELAADIRELGDEPINAPVFSKGGEIIAGRDRVAALLLNKAKRCWVRIADATPAERRALEASENLFRRIDNRNELIAARVAALAEGIAAQRQTVTTVTEGPNRRDVAEARAKVARQVGVTPGAVRQAEHRAKDIPSPVFRGNDTEVARGGEAAIFQPPPNAVQARGCPIDTFDVEVSAAFHERVSAVWGVLEKVNHSLVNAQTELAKLKGSPDFSGALWQRLKAEIHTAAYNTRAARPALVCLYCRDPDGVALLRDNCNGCNKLGWLIEEQRAMVPRELLAKGAPPVVGASAKRKASTLRIEDEAGNSIEITREDPESLPLPLEPIGNTKGDDGDIPF